MAARNNIAQAWASSRAKHSATLSTDGAEVKSYWHVIGHTEADGAKVAHDCRYSATTATHAGALKVHADKIIPCPDGHNKRVI